MSSTILSVLESLGYKFEGNGAYRRCTQHDSLVINVDKDLFYWNKLGIGGNAYQFLTRVEDMSTSSAMKYLNDLTGNYQPRLFPKQENELILPTKDQVEYLAKRTFFYHKNLLDDKDHIEYWYKQGINEFSIHKFKLGWAYECPVVPHQDSFTIPYIRGTDIINIRHRLNNNTKDKYRPEMAGLSNYLFNVNGLYRQDGINWPGDAILIEGEKKAIVFHQHGFRVAAIPGANAWRTKFVEEFNKAGIDCIYVLLDPGMEQQAEKIAKSIQMFGKKAKPIFLPDKPDDMILSGIKAGEILDYLGV